ncbi:MAG TPA: PEPxxWA-CTERM sorting domain-containing protein [Caulobacteraceae bacterium]|nr:PEPxxWA-CTERM sorting domain-containing protein [Caulobacteraceae bacterium]
MKLSNVLAGAAVVALGMAGAASAGIVTDYNNPIVINGVADCSFSTACAAGAGRGDEYVAQEFTLASAAVITGASFSEYDFGTTPTDANWGFIMNDGAGGLPGTILAAGTDTITSSVSLGTFGGENVDQNFFGVGPVALAAGTYYFALQAISSVPSTYLGQGANMTGAAESNDGGVTWAFGYENGVGGAQLGGVAVGLYTLVPEPGAWVLMLVGVGAVGAALRRRAARTASIA